MAGPKLITEFDNLVALSTNQLVAVGDPTTGVLYATAVGHFLLGASGSIYGFQGTQGWQGLVGYQGNQGNQGWQGNQGSQVMVSGEIVDILYTSLLAGVTSSTLIPGTNYKITDKGDLGIYVKSLSTNELSLIGDRKMLCPAYYAVGTDAYSNDWIGVWHNSKTAAADDLTIWGGKVWKNLTGTIGTASNDYTLDAVNWVVVPKASFSNNEYVEKIFAVNYDFTNDWIEKQWDSFGNVFGITYDHAQTYGYTFNPCDVSDWNCSIPSTMYFWNNKCVGVWNNVSNSITNNNISGAIFDNNSADIYNNSNKGDISNNVAVPGGIYNNSNAGAIISNDSVFIISNNTNAGDISSNNLDFNEIIFNSNRGTIGGNTCAGHISYNTNGDSIFLNTNLGSIQHNSCSGTIQLNANNGYILKNSNDGYITNNTSAVDNIYNNSNKGNITANSCTSNIGLNSNAGDINLNSNTGVISNNYNNGTIQSNANKGDISNNHNNGTITSFPNSGLSYSIINNLYSGIQVEFLGLFGYFFNYNIFLNIIK